MHARGFDVIIIAYMSLVELKSNKLIPSYNISHICA